MNPGDAPRRPAAPPGAPGHPQPPARGHQGVRLGSQKTMLPPMKYLTFPLCGPRRRRPRGDRAPGSYLELLDHLSPLPYSPKTYSPKTYFSPTRTSNTGLAHCPPRLRPLRGRRTDWPAATAADPGKDLES